MGIVRAPIVPSVAVGIVANLTVQKSSDGHVGIDIRFLGIHKLFTLLNAIATSPRDGQSVVAVGFLGNEVAEILRS